MSKEIYYEVNTDSFEPRDIFECGQCFRWNVEKNSYTGIFDDIVLNVKKEDSKIIFSGVTESDDAVEKIRKYFDLDRDYNSIKTRLSKTDKNMKIATEYGSGIRILNQNLWETIISFIISANNNIPRIKGIIERLSEKYGRPIEYSNKTYYTFPTPEELKDVEVEDYRKLGLGFRDVRLYETVKMVNDGAFHLDELYNKPTKEAYEELLKLSGVGPKVANCILLFSDLKRFDVFPIDVWVRRVINDLYIKNENEKKVKNSDIQKIADEKFGKYQGLAQQYLFYWRRELT